MPSPYITMADITGMVPEPFLTEALDDDNDGSADPAVLNVVLQQASDNVDALLGLRFSVPLANPLPPIVITAAQTFAAELCYQRRGKTPEQNPFFKAAEALRKTLEKIASGELPLAPTLERARTSAVVISAPARTTSTRIAT